MIALSSFSGYLVSGERSAAIWRRTASFLASFTGMLIKVPSGLKNWSICSVMGLSVIRSDHISLEIPLVK